MNPADRIVVRQAVAEDVIDLRHRVLRHGLPRESARFDNDARPEAFHVVAKGLHVVGCASFHPIDYGDEPAWQLRGMATDAAHRGQGLGRRVLEAAERVIVVRPPGDRGIVRLMWANARVAAIDFYTSVGWTIASERFEIPTAGPHFKIAKRLPERPLNDATDRLEVRTSGTGRGVFATKPIAAGELLLRYVGPLLRYSQTTPQTLAVQVGPDTYLGESGGLDDFVNHSCDPNAGLIIRNPTDVKLVALRDIAAPEQVLFDYSTTMDEDDFEFDCACNSANCRRRVGDFKHLPAERKSAYTTFGIVPGYNRVYVAAS